MKKNSIAILAVIQIMVLLCHEIQAVYASAPDNVYGLNENLCETENLAPNSFFNRRRADSQKRPASLYVLDKLISYTDMGGDLIERFEAFYYSLGNEKRSALDSLCKEGFMYYYLVRELLTYCPNLVGEMDRNNILYTQLKECLKYLGKLLMGEPGFPRKAPLFKQIYIGIDTYLNEMIRKWLQKEFSNPPDLDQLQNTILLNAIALEDQCPNRCRHCSAGHNGGPPVKYSDLVNLLNSGKVRFPSTYPVSITISEPLTYTSEDKDIVDVVKLLLEKGARVDIVTSGMGVNIEKLDAILDRLEELAKQCPGKINIVLSFNLFSQLEKERYLERIEHILRRTSLVGGMKVTYHNINQQETMDALLQIKSRLDEERLKGIEINEQYMTLEGNAVDIYIADPRIKLERPRWISEDKASLFSFLPSSVNDFYGFTLWPDSSISPFCSNLGMHLQTFGKPMDMSIAELKNRITDFFNRFLRLCQEQTHIEDCLDDVFLDVEIEIRKEKGMPLAVVETASVNDDIIQLIRLLRNDTDKQNEKKQYNVLGMFFKLYYLILIENGRLSWQSFRIDKQELLGLVKPYFVNYFKKKIPDWQADSDKYSELEICWLCYGIDLEIATTGEIGIKDINELRNLIRRLRDSERKKTQESV